MWAMSSTPVQCASAMLHVMIAFMLIPFGLVHVMQLLANETSVEKQKKYYLKKAVRDGTNQIYRAETG